MDGTGLAVPSPSRRTATPSAPYSRRPPSPPYIPASTGRCGQFSQAVSHALEPTADYLDAIRLTRAQLAVVTRGQVQRSVNRTNSWVYEQRRDPHSILDYMSLGPVGVVRDRAYLAREQISMIVRICDVRMLMNQGIDDACAALPGLAKLVVPVESHFDLLHQLPTIIHAMNTHMIEVSGATADGSAPRTGKILVTCDTGNHRSALVVAAYVMAMFGPSMSSAVSFITMQRFSCTFDEDIKRILQTWEDLLQATAAVSKDRAATQNTAFLPKSKRGVNDMSSDTNTDDGLGHDMDRFVGREAFVPFMDMD